MTKKFTEDIFNTIINNGRMICYVIAYKNIYNG